MFDGLVAAGQPLGEEGDDKLMEDNRFLPASRRDVPHPSGSSKLQNPVSHCRL